ncbi:hypothetical protein MLP_39450 [Microlunatus phosphovorus NM-1]|uniref:Uncharacterized protein n=1 Tax=Microlunatus phosphovorus (strain ATCC 700054 / DSM 10555 / JCM 9379 / NBRC 101784 / NCIMB 13414 / VKM Ac-1990 / NM-1) TaxID=1032480 RepID=F5XQT7_MICPN|nr:hypothetical protein MLP_39450 [Microlunatus phosphovorus NM-1]
MRVARCLWLLRLVLSGVRHVEPFVISASQLNEEPRPVLSPDQGPSGAPRRGNLELLQVRSLPWHPAATTTSTGCTGATTLVPVSQNRLACCLRCPRRPVRPGRRHRRSNFLHRRSCARSRRRLPSLPRTDREAPADPEGRPGQAALPDRAGPVVDRRVPRRSTPYAGSSPGSRSSWRPCWSG